MLGDIEIVADLEDAHGIVDGCSPDALLMLERLIERQEVMGNYKRNGAAIHLPTSARMSKA